MTEKQIERSIRRILKNQYSSGFWFKTHGSPLQHGGLPDIMGCYKGYFIGIELKVLGRNATPRQAKILNQIKEAGGFVSVVHSTGELHSFFKRVKKVLRRNRHRTIQKSPSDQVSL